MYQVHHTGEKLFKKIYMTLWQKAPEMNVLQANLLSNPEKHINYQFKRANLPKNTLENVET